jgi:UDP-N-acetylglucosamine:LPS N-acetylglucosamine transferase
LKEAYSSHPHFYVLNDKALLPPDMEGRTYLITHSERDWKQLLNLWEAWRILQRERPRVIISTGASPAVIFGIVGKVFFQTKVVFIETITRVHKPSLTARIMYHVADAFFYQWPTLACWFPRGKYVGRVV